MACILPTHDFSKCICIFLVEGPYDMLEDTFLGRVDIL